MAKVIARWKGHAESMVAVCWSLNGQRVISVSRDGTARVWDVKSGETVLGPINTDHEWVTASTKFVTGGVKDGAKIWDDKTDELLTIIKHNYWALSLAWTWDGNKLISASYGQIHRMRPLCFIKLPGLKV